MRSRRPPGEIDRIDRTYLRVSSRSGVVVASLVGARSVDVTGRPRGRGLVRNLLESELGHGLLHFLDPAHAFGSHDLLGLVDEPVDALLAIPVSGRQGEPPGTDGCQSVDAWL